MAANQKEAYGMSLEELTNQHEALVNMATVHGLAMLPGTSLSGANQTKEKRGMRSRGQLQRKDPVTSPTEGDVSQDTPKRKKGNKLDKSEGQKGDTPHCPFCGKTFKNDWSVRRHIICHTGQKDYNCFVCTKKFVTKWSLMRHMQNVHNVPISKDQVQDPGHAQDPGTTQDPGQLLNVATQDPGTTQDPGHLLNVAI